MDGFKHLRTQTLLRSCGLGAVIGNGAASIHVVPNDALLRLLASRLVPFLGHVVLPVDVLLDLVDAVLNNSERLSHLKVIHVLFIIELISELEQVVNLLLLLLLDILFGECPSRLGGLSLGGSCLARLGLLDLLLLLDLALSQVILGQSADGHWLLRRLSLR